MTASAAAQSATKNEDEERDDDEKFATEAAKLRHFLKQLSFVNGKIKVRHLLHFITKPRWHWN
jgi:hypothetical protein